MITKGRYSKRKLKNRVVVIGKTSPNKLYWSDTSPLCKEFSNKYIKPNYWSTFRFDRLAYLIILIAIILLVIGVL